MPRKSRQNKQSNNIHSDEQWQQAWDTPEGIDAAQKQALLNNIHRRIHTSRRNKMQWWVMGVGAAAAILVAVFIKFPGRNVGVRENKWQELVSNDTCKKVLLTDGSELWLAPHSAIRVHADFVQQRSTVLTQGTVFFRVAKDAQHPFTISVNRQLVTVVGTAFTIHTLDSVDIQLTVKEGKVSLRNAGEQQFLTAGQQVNTTRAITGTIKNSYPDAASWWLQQQVRWHNITLEELLHRVETYYQVKLTYDAIRKEKKVTLTWDLTIPLKENLAVLNALTGYHIH